MIKQLTAAALAAALVSTSAQAQPRHEVTQVVATVTFAFLPAYVAEHMGYFSAEGVDLKTMRASSAQAGLAAVMSGGAQYYLSTPIAGARSAAAGAPLVNCGALMNQNPSNIILDAGVAKRLGLAGDVSKLPVEDLIRKLRDLRFAAHTAGSSPDITLRFLARRAGLNPEKDLQILPITGDSILPAFEQKRIDGFIYSSPLAENGVIRHGGVKVLSLADGSYPPLAGQLSISLVCNRDWVEKQTDAAAATLRAIWRAMHLMKSDPAKARAAARKSFPALEERIFDAAFETNMKAFPDSPRLSAKQMSDAIDFHLATGGTPINVKLEQTFTNLAVDRAEQTMKR
jgi:NitT/TauT family transport system substrate-binding protein